MNEDNRHDIHLKIDAADLTTLATMTPIVGEFSAILKCRMSPEEFARLRPGADFRESMVHWEDKRPNEEGFCFSLNTAYLTAEILAEAMGVDRAAREDIAPATVAGLAELNAADVIDDPDDDEFHEIKAPAIGWTAYLAGYGLSVDDFLEPAAS